MHRLAFLVLLAGSVLSFSGPARAQATADQLNKLSLEALTAPPPGGARSYQARSYTRFSPGRTRRAGLARRPYTRVSRGYRFRYARPLTRSVAYRHVQAVGRFHRGRPTRPVAHRRVQTAYRR